jgi:hypothetical protein
MNMGIRWTRTGQIKGGHFMEAIAWSKEISAWGEKKHGVKVHTWLDTTGTVGAIRWSIDYPDLAAFEKANNAIMMDSEYWAFVTKALKAELFVDGHSVDTISKEM